MSDYSQLTTKIAQLQARLSGYVAPLSVEAPVVSGRPTVGQALFSTLGTWDHAPTGYAYQWKSAAVNVGTNAQTYVPVTGDVGKVINCTVSATNATGTGASRASNGVVVQY